MNLYDRDYCEEPTECERKEYERILEKEIIDRKKCIRKNLYCEYPEAIRHHMTLFPNNHIDLWDWRESGKMNELTERFSQIVHNPSTKERDILNYINHEPAYYIIGSLLDCKNFGHHETYIFPEFSIGNGKYRADYLIVGNNSGGYEFVFVELEAPNKRSTILSGYDGQSTRSGLNQIYDWKCQIESDFISLTKEFQKHCKEGTKLPQEFQHYDSTRMHYMVIVGLREDYNEVTYRNRREKAKYQNIEMYHYDNLIDYSKN